MLGGDLFVGGSFGETSQGDGVLTVADGGTVDITEDVLIGPNGTVNVSGGALNAARIDNTLGGEIHFTGGTLSMDELVGDLTQQGVWPFAAGH